MDLCVICDVVVYTYFVFNHNAVVTAKVQLLNEFYCYCLMIETDEGIIIIISIITSPVCIKLLVDGRVVLSIAVDDPSSSFTKFNLTFF